MNKANFDLAQILSNNLLLWESRSIVLKRDMTLASVSEKGPSKNDFMLKTPIKITTSSTMSGSSHETSDEDETDTTSSSDEIPQNDQFLRAFPTKSYTQPLPTITKPIEKSEWSSITCSLHSNIGW